MSDKLILNHSVLLAKGWYKHSKELWQDYRRTIIADGHFHPETRNDVAQILMMFITKHKELLKGGIHDESDIIQEIRNYMDRLIWWNKSRGIEESPIALYDDAVILFCHGMMQISEIKHFDKILAPSKKVLPFSIWEGETEEERDKRFAETYGDKLPYDDEDRYSKSMIEESLDEYYPLEKWIEDGNLVYESVKEFTLAERMPKEGEHIRKSNEEKPFYVTRGWLETLNSFTDELKKKYTYFIKL